MISPLLLFMFLMAHCAAESIPATTFDFDWSYMDETVPLVHFIDHHKPAIAEARSQLQCMLNTVHYYDKHFLHAPPGARKKAVKTIEAVFGKEPDMAKIKRMTIKLATSKIVIAQDNVDNTNNPGTFAITEPPNGGSSDGIRKIYIFSTYHQPTFTSEGTGTSAPIDKRQRARTLIHEASHALMQTWDAWTAVATGEGSHIRPVTGTEHHDHREAVKKRDAGQKLSDVEKSHILDPLVLGYWHRHYWLLKDRMSDAMHYNADTWAVFGYRCLYEKSPHPHDEKSVNGIADIRSIIW